MVVGRVAAAGPPPYPWILMSVFRSPSVGKIPFRRTVRRFFRDRGGGDAVVLFSNEEPFASSRLRGGAFPEIFHREVIMEGNNLRNKTYFCLFYVKIETRKRILYR